MRDGAGGDVVETLGPEARLHDQRGWRPVLQSPRLARYVQSACRRQGVATVPPARKLMPCGSGSKPAVKATTP